MFRTRKLQHTPTYGHSPGSRCETVVQCAAKQLHLTRAIQAEQREDAVDGFKAIHATSGSKAARTLCEVMPARKASTCAQ